MRSDLTIPPNTKTMWWKTPRLMGAVVATLINVVFLAVLLSQVNNGVPALDRAGQASTGNAIEVSLYPAQTGAAKAPPEKSPTLQTSRPTPTQRTQAITIGDVSPQLAPTSQSDQALASPTLSGGQITDVVASYQRRLLKHIETFRRYPMEARRDHATGTVDVVFALDRDGIVLGVWIRQSSGFAALDKEAIATVLRSQPLPPIPTELSDPLNITLPIAFGSSF